MLFLEENTTSLGTVDFPVLEGYSDFNTGSAFALIECVQNDYNIFKAMLEFDAREIADEKSNYVNEGERIENAKKAVSGLWEKIKKILESLGAKIKSIYNAFITRIDSLFASDKRLIKKYESTLKSKNISNMDFNGCKIIKSPVNDASYDVMNLSDIANNYKNGEKDTMLKSFLGSNTSDKKDFAKEFHDRYFGEKKEGKPSEFGLTLDAAIAYIKQDNTKKIAARFNTMQKTIGGMVKACRSQKGENEQAMHTYEAVKVYQEATILKNKCLLDAIKYEYGIYKALISKAIVFKESYYYDDNNVYAEAVTDEVTNAIDAALNGEDISDVSDASKSIKDIGLSDDPNKLTYDKTNCYSQKESYDFGSLLY